MTVQEIKVEGVHQHAFFFFTEGFHHLAGMVGDEAVAVDTIRRFKGLERLAVIVIADQEILDAPELAYVALSRARTLLSAYGPTEVLTALFGTRKPV